MYFISYVEIRIYFYILNFSFYSARKKNNVATKIQKALEKKKCKHKNQNNKKLLLMFSAFTNLSVLFLIQSIDVAMLISGVII